jgi:cation diffusion facilitator family transporter
LRFGAEMEHSSDSVTERSKDGGAMTIDHSRLDHEHVFLGAQHGRNERRTIIVVALTAGMMIAEIAAGLAFGSMALLADGFHMATHAGALAIAAAAYAYARRHAHDARFSFGTGKLGDLGAFASAVILAVVAVLIGFESFVRLASPTPIRFDEALVVAVLGLAVNLASAWLLHQGDDGHDHHHDHAHALHAHDHADHNLRAAYLHVLADALTSVLAIAGLLLGRTYGWLWVDPLIGLLGAAVILRWSAGLLRDSGLVLLDAVPDPALAADARSRLEGADARVHDLHLWRVGPGHVALVASVASEAALTPAECKERLAPLGLAHVTVEVNRA